MERVDESTWRLRVTERLITPGKFLFGGCGLASGIVALEEASARPTIYAAAHYLSFAPLGAEVMVTVNLAVVGRHVTQARAIATESGREVLTVNAALGKGDLTAPSPWLVMPDVPRPEDSPERVMFRRIDSSIFDHIETRIAHGRRFDELDGTPGSPYPLCGRECRTISIPRPRRLPSLATSCPAARRSPLDAAPWVAASTTRFESRPSSQRNGS